MAVKTLKENATEKERSDLLQELEVMKMLDPHPNVVRLLGCCTEKGKHCNFRSHARISENFRSALCNNGIHRAREIAKFFEKFAG